MVSSDATSFVPNKASEALLRWVCIEVSKYGGKTTFVFESVFSFNMLQLYDGVEGDEEGSVVFSSSFLFCFPGLRAWPIP